MMFGFRSRLKSEVYKKPKMKATTGGDLSTKQCLSLTPTPSPTFNPGTSVDPDDNDKLKPTTSRSENSFGREKGSIKHGGSLPDLRVFHGTRDIDCLVSTDTFVVLPKVSQSPPQGCSINPKKDPTAGSLAMKLHYDAPISSGILHSKLLALKKDDEHDPEEGTSVDIIANGRYPVLFPGHGSIRPLKRFTRNLILLYPRKHYVRHCYQHTVSVLNVPDYAFDIEAKFLANDGIGRFKFGQVHETTAVIEALFHHPDHAQKMKVIITAPKRAGTCHYIPYGPKHEAILEISYTAPDDGQPEVKDFNSIWHVVPKPSFVEKAAKQEESLTEIESEKPKKQSLLKRVLRRLCCCCRPKTEDTD